MKTIRINLFTVIFLIFGFCNCSQAQDSKEQPGRFIEQSINGQTYVYDTLMHIIKNQKNHIDTIYEPHRCDIGVREIKPHDYIVDKVFSLERKKELSGKVISTKVWCDSLGNILEVAFRLEYFSIITLEEINALEKECLKNKVEISQPCPENKYYLLSIGFRFPK